MVTVSAAELTSPSFTTSCTTYVPNTSIVKVGNTAVGFTSTALLPAGRLTNDH